ncbi:acetate kinase [Paenibacillus baekrokdamisoli]|uniref:Acetate kinase n=1 Tax=Paenibacillus baekrokdamisoli TaxID=1712516 RepID=A0A3G9IXR4_9BACL|nr:acetate kinase [Paenibacillus baekrokdamisoli]MBB3069701.1 acetate kinase [Paenibacillus baekrokdamisoli]BBH20945.1 acetate kinase [Paenibacillus baekrokdamisoli]
MIILVLNAGSSSLKYQIYNMSDESVLAQGRVERIGMEDSILTHEPSGKTEVRQVSEILDHNTAVKKLTDLLIDREHGVILSMKDINAVGHRVVHGGESFKHSVIVTSEVKQEIRKLIDLAPLHNPAAMMGIMAVEANLPDVSQVVVFDTAFHQSMPQETFLYPIPMVLYRRHKIRRYGFHGTSHDYVSRQAAMKLNKPLESLKMVTCHIGNGASCAAILDGKSFDTSMGLTPLEGLMMGTRSGDLDPAIVPFTMDKEELTLNEVNSMLNKHSGLQAISGFSSDMREITDAMKDGDKQAKLAFDMYTYRLRKYIGAYAAGMNGIDVLVFTAGVGENSVMVRQAVCENLSFMGIELDNERNEIRSKEVRLISTDKSRVSVLVVPTNEELIIARDTYQLVRESL